MFYDFHADLLSQVALIPGSSFYDEENKNSVPQLVRGKVACQVFPLFADGDTQGVELGEKQIELYGQLTSIAPLTTFWAIENGSCFLAPHETFKEGLQRLESWIQKFGKPLYIGMTWNPENRLGGGSDTQIGLHKEGRELLHWMNEQSIGLDFSHTSDPMAWDLLNEIDKNHYDLSILASHSNFRAVCPHPRNLPDDLALQIIERKGLIGINLFAPFLGKTKESIAHHIEHGLQLGAQDALVLGSDFFSEKLSLALLRHNDQMFFSEFDNSTCFPQLFSYLIEKHNLDKLIAEKIAYKNGSLFIRK